MCSSSNLSRTAQEMRGTTGIQAQSCGSSPACVVLELFLLNSYFSLTFTYRYSDHITEVFSYKNLQTVLCKLVENAVFALFSICPYKGIPKVTYSLMGVLLFVGLSPPCVLLLLNACVARGVVSWASFWEWLLCLSLGMAFPNLNLRGYQGLKLNAFARSHTSLPSFCVLLLSGYG
jgi:hypothetical protein